MYGDNLEFSFTEKTPNSSFDLVDQMLPKEKKIKNNREVVVQVYLTKEENEKLKNVSSSCGRSLFVREALRKLGVFN